jgi:hypothetical protein
MTINTTGISLQNSYIFMIGLLSISVLIGSVKIFDCLASEQYVNYTSYKFKIQFQYPATWIQSEKITDKEKGSDIWVTNYSNKSSAVFWISGGNDSHLGSDLEVGFKNLDIILTEKYANKSYKIIQPPAISTIDGKIAVTFIHSFVESLDGIRIEEVQQIWLVYVGPRDYYLIGFKAPSQLFTGIDNSQARDNFIKSVMFLD